MQNFDDNQALASDLSALPVLPFVSVVSYWFVDLPHAHNLRLRHYGGGRFAHRTDGLPLAHH